MIVFSHGNSYSASTYRRLFDGWRAAGHEVAAIEHFGHDAHYPVDRRWSGMTQQLTGLIDSLPQSRVWLVGHSMGGYLSLLAAGRLLWRLHLQRGRARLRPLLLGQESLSLVATGSVLAFTYSTGEMTEFKYFSSTSRCFSCPSPGQPPGKAWPEPYSPLG